MGLFSSIFGKKSKTSTTQTSTTTPNVPEWITTPVQNLTNSVMALSNSNPYSYVAPASELQTQAWDAAGNLGSYAGNFDEAADIMRGVAGSKAPSYAAASGSAQSLLDGLDKYMSPYRKQVVDAALADWDYSAGQQRAQDDLDLAASGAFGGSGAALTKSMTSDALIRGRNTTESTLLDQMFNRGAALSGEDASRRQQMEVANMQAANEAAQFNAAQEAAALERQLAAAKGLTDITNTAGTDARANIDMLSKLGGEQRGIEQDYRNAPLTLLDFQTDQFGQLPLNLFPGETTTGSGTSKTTSSPSPFTVAVNLAKTAAMFSDVRLKTDIERVGELPNGLGVYEFNYVWGGPRLRGVMAQEVINIKPEAVIEHESGYLMVDYGAL